MITILMVTYQFIISLSTLSVYGLLLHIVTMVHQHIFFDHPEYSLNMFELDGQTVVHFVRRLLFLVISDSTYCS